MEDLYWEEYDDFISENRVDKRWILRSHNDDGSYGSLRIVSHPDLRPGYLRCIYTQLESVRERSKVEMMRVIADYHMNNEELEVFNIKNDTTFSTTEMEAPYKDLEEIFKVEVF